MAEPNDNVEFTSDNRFGRRSERSDNDPETGGPFGGLSASEAGRRGALVRKANEQRRAGMPADERARTLIEASLDALVSDLLDAAQGRGLYSTLNPSDRLKALTKALEYGLGRPGQQPKAPAESPRLPTAEDLF